MPHDSSDEFWTASQLADSNLLVDTNMNISNADLDSDAGTVNLMDSIGPENGSKSSSGSEMMLFKYSAIPVAACAYATHRYYRRRFPRRLLPPFTSLRLFELYVFITSAFIAAADSAERQVEIMRDGDLLTIDFIGRQVGRVAIPLRDGSLKARTSSTTLDTLKRIREHRYYDSGIFGKLAWWQNHIWSREETWYTTAWVLSCDALDAQKESRPFPQNWDDWDACITYTANCTDRRASSYPYLTDIVLSYLLLEAVGYSVPAAMFARWTGRALLYRPVNFLQRILIGAYFYCDFMRQNQRLAYIQQFPNKERNATFLRACFGIDKEDAEVAMATGEMPPFYID
ncbi:hypothetical protein C8Q74DRAFT_1220312 [Fomes fomentarius]|nr:hypothetical protein C8Q74DRAFT_1220312 [Fomes fomentarius]